MICAVCVLLLTASRWSPFLLPSGDRIESGSPLYCGTNPNTPQQQATNQPTIVTYRNKRQEEHLPKKTTPPQWVRMPLHDMIPRVIRCVGTCETHLISWLILLLSCQVAAAAPTRNDRPSHRQRINRQHQTMETHTSMLSRRRTRTARMKLVTTVVPVPSKATSNRHH